MTNYRLGAAFERRVQAALTRDGYTVIRSAGSHGVADLIAAKQGEWLLVQCKRTNPQIAPADRRALVNLASSCEATPVVAYMPGVRGIAYRQLTGVGPKDWVAWSADREDVA